MERDEDKNVKGADQTDSFKRFEKATHTYLASVSWVCCEYSQRARRAVLPPTPISPPASQQLCLGLLELKSRQLISTATV